MRAEIISIGTELLVGSIVNTNARFLSQCLAENAVDVYHQTTVGDNVKRIIEAFEQAAERSELLITSGGLGPTEDDVTLEALSKFIHKPLKRHLPTYRHVLARLKSHQYPMTPMIAKQCDIPEKSHAIKNFYGTAPGVIVQTTRREKKIWVLVLPGPPRELEPMFTQQALPLLRRLAQIPAEHFLIRSMKITGLVEVQVAQKVPDLLKLKPPATVGIYAKPDEVELKIMAKHASQQRSRLLISRIEKEIRKKLKEKVMGADSDTLSSVTGDLLRKGGMTLAVAESCTGGLISNRVSQTPGSSDYFLGGIVCYSNRAKNLLLGISEASLKKSGAVSEDIALQLSKNVRQRFGSSIGIGVSGIAGPSGGSRAKPVGLVYIAITSPKRGFCSKELFFGNRLEIQSRAANKALDLLRLELLKPQKN